MNLKNYFNEIKHFLKENVNDPENLGTEDTGETPPEDEGTSQGEGDNPNNIPVQQNSVPASSPSEEPDLQAAGTPAGDNPPAAPDQGGNAGQQMSDPETDKQQGGGESGKVPSSQPKTEKFGTILNQLKGLLDTFEQAKKAAGFETIDDVKKAAQENSATNSGGSTDGATANTGDDAPAA